MRNLLNGNSSKNLQANSTLTRFKKLGPLSDSKNVAKGSSNENRRQSYCGNLSNHLCSHTKPISSFHERIENMCKIVAIKSFLVMFLILVEHPQTWFVRWSSRYTMTRSSRLNFSDVILLKLATRTKLHVGHLLYGSWYFSWIPLIKRCRVDLKIIRFW